MFITTCLHWMNLTHGQFLQSGWQESREDANKQKKQKNIGGLKVYLKMQILDKIRVKIRRFLTI